VGRLRASQCAGMPRFRILARFIEGGEESPLWHGLVNHSEALERLGVHLADVDVCEFDRRFRVPSCPSLLLAQTIMGGVRCVRHDSLAGGRHGGKGPMRCPSFGLTMDFGERALSPSIGASVAVRGWASVAAPIQTPACGSGARRPDRRLRMVLPMGDFGACRARDGMGSKDADRLGRDSMAVGSEGVRRRAHALRVGVGFALTGGSVRGANLARLFVACEAYPQGLEVAGLPACPSLG
jgi:hypothetical protein